MESKHSLPRLQHSAIYYCPEPNKSTPLLHVFFGGGGIYVNIFLPPTHASYSLSLLKNKSNLLYNIVRVHAMVKWLAVSNCPTLSTS